MPTSKFLGAACGSVKILFSITTKPKPCASHTVHKYHITVHLTVNQVKSLLSTYNYLKHIGKLTSLW